MSNLTIRPDQHEERARLRTCSSCHAHDGERCRRGSPGPHGFPPMDPQEWCLEWAWRVNPRVTWDTAIAPAERPDFRPKTHEEVPF